MSDDVRAAAERRRNHDPRTHYDHDTWIKDLVLLADAYLAEHPADSDVAVTVGWAESSEPLPDDNAIRAAIESRYGVSCRMVNTSWLAESSYFEVAGRAAPAGYGHTRNDAVKDWAAKNGVAWMLPSERPEGGG